MAEQAEQPKRCCSVCGGEDMPGVGVCSSVKLFAGYGSDNDGTECEIPVCGEFLDWIWKCMPQDNRGGVEDSVWFSWWRE